MPENWLNQKSFKFIPKSVLFKAISNKDMAFLSELYRSTRWQEVLQAPWNDEQRIEFLDQQFTAQHEHYNSHYPKAEKLLILKDKKPIGRIYIDRDENSICLIDVALLTQHRGSGLGTKLLKELLIEAQATKKKIVIHVENFNPAYQWYLKHGFQQVEDKGVYQYMEWYPKSAKKNQSG
ncbi:GNAT family N-acetyltransferase [Marinicella gelatinilytica]|uniref:GNAT family N-acetyltransferase n=1 Tax=Marinicella gelatinilytica TaxID=2996017 RepID=UPI0022608DDF|nr:GNAT family N-acetyltransferase [Marinicella gelatinilytica]MCX7544180.1 GNAT family N-acetyltransferase [Marinicella gelatinilytica]